MKKIEKIIIAGGGTAGWMTAAALGKLLGKAIDITLIESDEIGTVGVGEATIPTMAFFHKLLEINEREFMRETNATFKLGIQFENWRQQNHRYLHAFGVTGKDCWAAGFQHFWMRGRELGIADEFGHYCLERRAAEENLFSHLPNNGLNYAFHLDATAYAKYLRKFSESFGVKRMEGKIEKAVVRESDGFIESIRLESGACLTADFFIDCTGFRALLIEKALKTGYEDWSHWLPCDSAIAVQTESTGAPVPYTRSIAHGAGWQWRIPLRHRVGNGLVYCSKYLDDEAAMKLLLDNIETHPLSQPRVIKFCPGRRLQQWNKNCLAIGLSGGFLEPLESTSIHLIQQNIIRFLRMFPAGGVVQSDIDEFNQQAEFDINHIRDFIILHYHVTERDDTDFWNYCRTMPVPESLGHRIQLFKDTGRVFRNGNELFDDSWQQVMIGQGLMPEHHHPLVDTMSKVEVQMFLQQISKNIEFTLATLSGHQEYLEHYCV
ncbi:tryptophan halogenase family protein [Cellvibrio sp. NN19]|uniref:tryptophan halogenase family protein n=1 Tax=Cellvibrio chitinivorans TaxID=3102792 RepID=UPI002B40E203|nr:tryptophan halogenase family protein [Cellvibrio sp. NN19]